MTYEEYIASSIWQAKRKARMLLDGIRCRLCDEDGSRYRLEVHHRPGSYARIPNESIDDDLITLCARCHDLITSAIRDDRYKRREQMTPEPVEVTVHVRKEGITHGMAYHTLQIDLVCTSDHAQRADCRPPQQVGQGDQTDLVETKEDRRRL